MLRGLYGITDKKLTPYNSVLLQVEMALKGGMKILQLRDKDTNRDELLGIAKELKELCSKHKATFIIDDDIELAIKCDADGLHIGEDDIGLVEARGMLGDKIIGVSCYGDITKALDAERFGANYVAFGSFFPSPTKPLSKTVSPNIITEAKKKLKIPVCAIGGITLQNCASIIKNGADMVAVISDLWGSEDLFQKSLSYSKFYW